MPCTVAFLYDALKRMRAAAASKEEPPEGSASSVMPQSQEDTATLTAPVTCDPPRPTPASDPSAMEAGDLIKSGGSYGMRAPKGDPAVADAADAAVAVSATRTKGPAVGGRAVGGRPGGGKAAVSTPFKDRFGMLRSDTFKSVGKGSSEKILWRGMQNL